MVAQIAHERRYRFAHGFIVIDNRDQYRRHSLSPGPAVRRKRGRVSQPLTPFRMSVKRAYELSLFVSFCTIPDVPLVSFYDTVGLASNLSGPACSSRKAVTRNQNAGAARRSKPPTVGRSTLQDQQFEHRLRIAKRLVQALREAGRSCGLADEAYSRNGVDLPSRH